MNQKHLSLLYDLMFYLIIISLLLKIMISLYELYVKYTWIRGCENANGLELAPNLVIIKDVKSYTLLLSQMHYINGKIIEEYLGPNQAQLITIDG